MKNLFAAPIIAFGLVCWLYFLWLYPGVLLLPLGFAFLSVGSLLAEVD